jgi:hypothetical protein
MTETTKKLFDKPLVTAKLSKEEFWHTLDEFVAAYKENHDRAQKSGILHELAGSPTITSMQKVQFLTEIASEINEIEPSKYLRKTALKLLVSRVLSHVYNREVFASEQVELWACMEFFANEPNLPTRLSHSEQNQIAALMGIMGFLHCFEDHGKFMYETYVKAMINTGTIHAIFSQSPLRDFPNSISQSWRALRTVRPLMFDALPILLQALKQLNPSHEFKMLFTTPTATDDEGFIWTKSPEFFRRIKRSTFYSEITSIADFHLAFCTECMAIQTHCAKVMSDFRRQVKFDAPEYRLAEACSRLLLELINEIYND